MQIVGEPDYECDLNNRFDDLDVAVAVDLNESFAGWKMRITQAITIKPADVWKLFDGVSVFYTQK